ncbi:MAG TPA: hypothetical protein VMW51_08455 [Terriglobia bacterium]|nr:hypothetical protein [Terriglobia bacterium]
MRRKAVYPVTLIVIVLALSSLFLITPRPNTEAQTTTNCCGTNPPTAPREIVFPYYSLADGFNSTLLLVSSSPTPLNFIVAVHSLSGQTEISNSITIQPGENLPIDMRALLTSLGADVTGTFSQGNVSVYFEGTIMPLAGQMTIENPARHWVQQVDMVENDPGRTDIPAVLSGQWWGLSGGRDATIMVTNASGSTVTADVFLAFGGKEHKLDPLVFNGNQTRLLSVAEMLGTLNASVSEAPEGRITIIQRGPNPALMAQGRVTDSVTVFSTTLEFPDPARQRASALHASGLPIGTPAADSPYAGDGYFTPHVIASNLTDKPQTVTITVEYAEGTAWKSVEGPGGPTTPNVRVTGPFKTGAKDPNEALNHPTNPDPLTLTGQFTLAPLAVGPDGTVDFSLDAVMSQLPLPLPYASLRIQYSGPPGSMIAQVSSVDQRQDLVVDARTMNEGDGWAGSGSNPWRLDSQTDSILFLTDESDSPARIGLDVTAGGVHYYLIRLKVAPHETRAINLRTLRDAQTPDLKGNKIPAGATDGAVNWVRLDSMPVEGRMMVIQKQQGMASSYDCSGCPCPGRCNILDLYPNLFGLPPGFYEDFFSTGTYVDCNGYQFYYDDTYATGWSVDNPSVIQMDSSIHNRADAESPGTATITGSFEACTFYDTNPDFDCPCEQWRIFTATSTGNVDSLVFTISSGGAPNDPDGVVARQSFNLQIRAKTPSGTVPDTSFNASSVPFTLVNKNTSVGEVAPSTVNFSSGTANANVTIVEASGLTNSVRQIVVAAYATGTVFFPYVYMNVVATDEGLVNYTTACGYVIPPNAQMVALPYSGNPDSLCGHQVLVVNGSASQQVPVEDAGPWCPHSVSTTDNPCVCSNDNYWQGTAIPYAATNSCSSNGAGIDLGDGTYSAVRGGTNGPVDWKFP